MKARKVIRIRIVCAAESHAPKVATVDRLKLYDYGDHVVLQHGGEAVLNGGHPLRMQGTGEILIEDQVVSRREVYGTSRRAPNMSKMEASRHRRPIECPLCGLRVELRAEKALELARGLAAAGVSEIRLSALAASL